MKTIDFEINGVCGQYHVTYQPLINKDIHLLPPVDREQIGELFVTAQAEPQRAIPKLQKLQNRYPTIPQLLNFLTTAYSLLGDYDSAERYARECCEKHPHYLFGKINLAEIQVQKNQPYKIPDIFSQKQNLCLLYPQRNRFHLTEVIGFTGVWGKYHLWAGDRKATGECLRIIRILSPESPMAKQLRTRLDLPS